MLERRIDVDYIETLFDYGVVTYAGFEKAKIIIDYLKNENTMSKVDNYFILSEKYNKSELTIRNIIQKYNRYLNNK